MEQPSEQVIEVMHSLEEFRRDGGGSLDSAPYDLQFEAIRQAKIAYKTAQAEDVAKEQPKPQVNQPSGQVPPKLVDGGSEDWDMPSGVK